MYDFITNSYLDHTFDFTDVVIDPSGIFEAELFERIGFRGINLDFDFRGIDLDFNPKNRLRVTQIRTPYYY